MKDFQSMFSAQIQARIDPDQLRYQHIGQGWLPLVEELDEALSKTDPDYKIRQIKEKFGTLRFYVEEGVSEQGRQLIREAEEKSAHICDVCGGVGKIQPNKRKSWLVTRCDDHLT